MRTFRNEFWTGHKKHWASGFLGPGIPRTNNALENYNRNIKRILTNHLTRSTGQFLHELKLWVSSESDIHVNTFKHDPDELVS